MKSQMKPYFTIKELAVMVFFALISALLSTLPFRPWSQSIGIPGPAVGTSVFGGVVFVFWIALAYNLIQKRYSAIVTSLFIVSFCLIMGPWYGVIKPEWFGIYGIIALLSMGASIELINKKFINGGVGNFLCLIITWAAIGIHTGVWIEPIFAPVMAIAGFISGCIGAFLANIDLSKQ